VIKLLHIIDTLGVGGAEKLLVGIINKLEGYEHHLIILNKPEDLRPLITVPCKFTNLDIQGKADFFRSIGKVKKYIRENGIDIVHAHLYNAIILSRLATQRKVKLFNSIHAIQSLAAYKVNRLTLYVDKLTYRKRHHIVAVSREVLNDFEKYVGVKGPSTVLYNFIDEKFFAPPTRKEFSSDQLKLVAVGNLRYQKNYPYLIEVFKQLPSSVSLDVYGEGPMRNELQQAIDEHKLNIRLCGLRDDLNKVLPQYDAFLMSSFYEGQPLSLLEAMACGLPSILADIPVLTEVTGKNAIYFGIDNPANLVEVIRKIQAKEYNLAELAAGSHQRVNEFAHEYQYMESLTNLYGNRSSTNPSLGALRATQSKSS
jgi:glycosyltransferase involved in cell wall biosynthesis